ncbi:hypothetical protein EJB05_00083, partial [Eragrostis curvula]
AHLSVRRPRRLQEFGPSTTPGKAVNPSPSLGVWSIDDAGEGSEPRVLRRRKIPDAVTLQALSNSCKHPLRRNLTEAQKDAKRARDRERYAKMTLEQKKAKRAKSTLTEAQKDAKRARERAQYAKLTPEQKKDKRAKSILTEEQNEIQKQAKRIYARNHFAKISAEQRTSRMEEKKSDRKKRREELCSEYIAMENPLFVPDLIFPNSSAKATSNPKLGSDFPDISMIGPTWKPLNIPPVRDQSPNNDEDNGSNNAHGVRHQRVTHGERQTLRARRNEQFHKPKNPLDPSLEEDHSLTDDEIAGCKTTEMDDNGTKMNDEGVVYENDSEIDDADIWLEKDTSGNIKPNVKDDVD